jgi:hypothetical protein
MFLRPEAQREVKIPLSPTVLHPVERSLSVHPLAAVRLRAVHLAAVRTQVVAAAVVAARIQVAVAAAGIAEAAVITKNRAHLKVGAASPCEAALFLRRA